MEIEAHPYRENLRPGRDPLGVHRDEIGAYVVTAHSQVVYLEDGDWIVAEPDGSGYYPIKPHIMEKRWEPIE